MQLTSEEEKIRDDACNFVEQNKDKLVDRFITSKNPLKLGFITIFMAGSPGSGKTEFSLRYLPLIYNKDNPETLDKFQGGGIDISSVDTLIIRIDVDEIREFIPQYTKTDTIKGIRANAHVVQKAATKGLDILRIYCLENDISFLHDGTFGNYDTMKEIVKKSIRDNREVHIYYLYIDPLVAWEFTKAREFIEGRNIIKEKFIQQYFNAPLNVDRIKSEFGEKIKINIVLKDENNEVFDIRFNHPSIDLYIKTQHNKNIIKRYTPEELSDLLD